MKLEGSIGLTFKCPRCKGEHSILINLRDSTITSMDSSFYYCNKCTCPQVEK